ncbi:MAG TPA: MFS transporter [Patescibacteria group bacterium]|nr:MFS transporter [Patescibacteria group bacterium]
MKPGIKSILKTPKFLYLWVSQILSQLTISIMNFLLLAKLYDVTGSTIATSFLWLAFALPAVIFGPIGAAAVDLTSRRKTLMITNLLQALTIFIYLFINQQSIFILYTVVLIYSILNQFYNPAEAAYLPSTVSKENLAQANSLFFLTIQATLIVGFGFAGLIQKLIGFEGVLILSSIFLFAGFVSTSFLTEIKSEKKIPDEFEKALKTFFDSILEGYEFIKQNKSVLYPLLLILGIQSGLTIIVVSLPVIAQEILNISVNYAGVAIVVPAGIGAVIGSIYIPRLMKVGIRKKILIENSMFLVFVSMAFLAIGVPLLPAFYKVLIAPFVIFLVGIGFVGINIPTLTYVQEVTPSWLRGRVFGNLGFLITIVTVFPVLFSGAISEVFGVRTMLAIMAFTVLLVFIYSVKKGKALVKENFTTAN